jgi:aspartyl-tRNA(Asn)/glutamyl-tRNA(Gln) amidotransferase subunit B
LIKRIADKTISGKIAKTVFEAMYTQQGSADDIIERAGLKQVTDTASIENLIDEVLVANPHQLEQYQAGKEKLFGFFVGQVMKISKGKANPQQLNELLKKKLSKRE